MSDKSTKTKTAKSSAGLTTFALIMMNVTIIAGIGNDVQQSFYGLTSVTYFAIGALLFFIPTGLVAAELASGWSERGGIFRWVGEGIGEFAAISCLLILWMQTTFNFGSGIPGSAATIGFFTPDFDWAVNFAEQSHPWTVTLPIMLGWLVYYWFMCWLATKGVKIFSRFVKYGVLLGTFLPLAVMTILCIVWVAQGHTPNISYNPEGLIPHFEGLSTLALAAGVFFSFAGVDMNAAYIRELKNPNKQFPLAIFVSMFLAFLIFVVGTLVIATVIPENQINLLYTLNAVYRELGACIGFPDLYLVFVYLGMANGFASLVTNLAGPSFMLGQAGRSGFLPKFLQNNNKHGMPSKLMYTQMGIMTVIAFVVFLLPNVEGFVALISQAITILYMFYYVLMFIAFLKLRYEQPNRPRGFRVPGGMVGAWLVAGIGICAAVFAIVLAFIPPAQLAAEVGSGLNYVLIILGLLIFVFLICFVMYRLSRKHDWVDPTNQFAPFTWQIEGFKKPTKVLSNVPSIVMCTDQNPLGMPIKRPYDPNQMIDLPNAKDHKAQSAAAQKLIDQKGLTPPPEPQKAALLPMNHNQIKTVGYAAPAKEDVLAGHYDNLQYSVPTPTAEEIAAAKVPADPKADAAAARAKEQEVRSKLESLEIEAEVLEQQAEADDALAKAQDAAREAAAAATNAEAAAKAAMGGIAAKAADAAKATGDAAKQTADAAKSAATDAAAKAAGAAADAGSKPADGSSDK